ncbi:hypothetical protein LTR99_000174 [Exophiala xenobiotica]|uniref:Uncharacterized protein n=1 Tax=Vermiconidia calcicola TaxID=1690605 RepID=A0AAV9PVH9_9PEZI|nr:hypothetical protein LTR96_009354 [Exophiala xenobiotica]KAK5530018.1 hypothetical protein LTR25_009262 [Vermiconidia calcicola]KAK5547337.1 hypothetical protein LTR23_002557 [Chaetothyriales sp. CCFEE 6169]KAK5307204.1 hypothetical protein LTR99_000174 [Exophiala xenobiotica]KAK5343891.1 hypothetical protein LTR98_001522 [Exophiala xenobiotica]
MTDLFSETNLPTGNDVDGVTTEYEVRFVWDNCYASHAIIIPATMHRSMKRIWEAIKDQLPAFARAQLDTPHTRLYFVAQETVWQRFYMQFNWNETRKFSRWYTRNTNPYRGRPRVRIDIRAGPTNLVERVEDGWRMSTATRTRLEETLVYFPGDDDMEEVDVDVWGNLYQVKDEVDDDENDDDDDEVDDKDSAPSTLKWLRE